MMWFYPIFFIDDFRIGYNNYGMVQIWEIMGDDENIRLVCIWEGEDQ